MGLEAQSTSGVKAFIAAVLSTATLAVAAPVRADDFGQALQRGIYDDATVTVHLRSYYFDRTNPGPPNNVAWAGGGWVGYETGWLFDALRFGVVGYT